MSTRQIFAHRQRVTWADPETQDVMRMIGVAIRKRAMRPDIIILSVDEEFGAPARFVPSLAEIHVNKKWIMQVDMTKVHNWDELVLHYPTVAGIILHEVAHAAHSLNEQDMRRILGAYGDRHLATFLLLSEGHCECHLFPGITPWEQAAMRSMVLEIVLKEVTPETIVDEDDVANDIRMAFRLTALLAARATSFILDISEPKTQEVYKAMVVAMRDYFDLLSKFATEFAAIDQVGMDADLEKAHEIVKHWMMIEDAAIQEAKEEREREKREREEQEPSEEQEEQEEEESGGTGEEEEESSEPGEPEPGESSEEPGDEGQQPDRS